MFYPVMCISDDARAGKMMFAKFDPTNVPEIINCGPMKLGRCYVTDVINMNPYEKIKDYSGDVLIVHGTEDKLDYSKNAYEMYLHNGTSEAKPERCVELKIINGGQHGFCKKHDVMAIDMLKCFAQQ